ncbi:lactonase family protein [Paenibacillus sp. R14(2021)]|uniref:lactonase family protein n=1 Tax=Paenibacillus sp. R14(2021) TaxID=2859228 RepID=UPI001C6131A3|nr:lactonase family protein [Paenibacillus sp. R14(2021)]
MGEQFIYTGSYAGAEQEGVSALRFAVKNGGLTRQAGLAGMHHPSFVHSNAAGTRLYVVSETGAEPGSLFSYAVDAGSGELTLIHEVSTLGGSPCHITLDAEQQLILVTNYTGGSISLYAVQTDGSLLLADHIVHEGRGPRDDRQEAPHPHSSIIDAANQYVLVADLGTDELVSYRIDHEARKLIRQGSTSTAPGAGPRHMAFSPSGERLYVINELDNTVGLYAYEAVNAELSLLQVISTLPESFAGESSCADIHVRADGRFLYASNRGHDSIAVYRIDEEGRLALVEIVSSGGRTPRNFAISPDGQHLLAANQDSDSIVGYRINKESGRLSPTGQTFETYKPVCIAFV